MISIVWSIRIGVDRHLTKVHSYSPQLVDRVAKWGPSKMQTFGRLLRDQSGATAAEYALILAIVGASIAGAALLLGNTISAAMSSTGSRINSCQGGTC